MNQDYIFSHVERVEEINFHVKSAELSFEIE